ncbi:hypothetical protein A8709_01930 [Paenibacillus pectinilyticus]|uniref:Uncharacterized protein n=1 Tax=Paenibacillus pectinilyticus TaxID=512399 RepID=A0A1C1A6N2_9BACL|nr:hypothetical protein [Paenibacillus pectinilyticus]OCT16222.1 hypothetical protein A8709_01930 [Paenibacillus pectinilyticus]
MLTYTFDVKTLEISEIANGQDVEFHIYVHGDAAMEQRVKDIQHDFEHNHVLMDVLFYAFKNHHYQFIVRKDYYEEFILSLMKHRLLTSVSWV